MKYNCTSYIGPLLEQKQVHSSLRMRRYCDEIRSWNTSSYVRRFSNHTVSSLPTLVNCLCFTSVWITIHYVQSVCVRWLKRINIRIMMRMPMFLRLFVPLCYSTSFASVSAEQMLIKYDTRNYAWRCQVNITVVHLVTWWMKGGIADPEKTFIGRFTAE